MEEQDIGFAEPPIQWRELLRSNFSDIEMEDLKPIDQKICAHVEEFIAAECSPIEIKQLKAHKKCIPAHLSDLFIIWCSETIVPFINEASKCLEIGSSWQEIIKKYCPGRPFFLQRMVYTKSNFEEK